MEKFVAVTGPAAALPQANVDTDAIIPAGRMVTMERRGLGKQLFGDWRYDEEGRERPDFVLNRPQTRHAVILMAGDNYACGSSREHAVWAMMDFGFRAVVAPSFASIFYENCFKNGLLPVTLPEATVEEILTQLAAAPGSQMSVDLQTCTVTTPAGRVVGFALETARRTALLEGLDYIGQTLARVHAIDAFQAADRERRPWVWRRGG
jgi:3-isopropylmalate/(R)-2-methylmalate dehydratase small subunit